MAAHYILGTPEHLTAEYNYCLTTKNYVLLARFIYQAILKDYDYLVFDELVFHKDCQPLVTFSAQVIQKITELCPNSLAKDGKALVLADEVGANLLIVPEMLKNLHMITANL